MFEIWETKTDDGQPRYERQTEILRQALAAPDRSLETLLELMRTQGESAIYLCGTRLDHDFGLGSPDIATMISVLPQGKRKAAEPGYHPGSTEIHLVFQGSLVLEMLRGDTLETLACGQYDLAVMPPGRCHRVRYEKHRRAASLIVKTNPGYEPKAVRCQECVRFADKSQCPLCMSWERDRGIHLLEDTSGG